MQLPNHMNHGVVGQNWTVSSLYLVIIGAPVLVLLITKISVILKLNISLLPGLINNGP